MALRVCAVVAWTVVAVLLVAALLRWVAWDRAQVLVLVDALTFYVYLPAWPIAAVAALRRSWGLAAAAALVVVAQVVFVAPEFLAATPLPAAAMRAPTLRLFDANVYAHNPDMAGYAAQIRQDRPDLVTLEEASPEDEAQLLRLGALGRLPYRVAVAREGPTAFVVASRYPIDQAAVSAVDGSPFLVRLVVLTPEGRLPVWVVHTSAPAGSSWALWSAELSTLRALLVAHRPSPVLVAGDFNATWGNRGFRAVLSTGLVDAAAARADALDMTWSQMFWTPPLLRIDHVLTGGAVVVTSIHSVAGPGSDHRELRAIVAMPGMRRAPAASAPGAPDGTGSLSAVLTREGGR